MMKEYTAALAVLVLAMFTMSCDAGSFVEPGLEGGDPGEPPAVQVESLTLDSLPALIAEDDTIHLRATALDSNGDSIGEPLEVEWSSSDETVASFETTSSNEAELLTRKPGTTTITASYQESSASMTVEVHNRPVDLVYVAGSSQQAASGAELPDSLTVRAIDKRGDAVSGVYLDFVVDAGGGTVSPKGGSTAADGSLSTVWTLGESGRQVVEARASQAQARVKNMKDSVVVFTAQIADTTTEAISAATVAVDPATDTVTIDSTIQLKAAVYDHAGSPMTGADVAWSSSNANIATVDGAGIVTGVGEGQIIVSATAEGASDSASITVAGSAGGTLTVSSAADTLYGIGDTTTLTAEARAADGSVIPEPDIQWSTQDTSIATVDTMGTVTAKALGVAMIAASAVCCDSGDFVEVTVVEDTTPGADAPMTVTDLQVTSVGADSVRLQWTQVDDGTGYPANYALRYGSPNLDWGSAYSTEVTVRGTAVGEAASYAFRGLAADADYEFALVSYRGTLNVDAVFGGSSNYTTVHTPDVQQASVTISPANVALDSVGDTITLIADARASDGTVVVDPGITWTSLDTAIATMDETGLLTAKGLGSALIVAATACCGSDTVPASIGQLHRHEPAGFAEITTHSWSTVPGEDSWTVYDSNNRVTIGSDATAPLSPPDVAQGLFPSDGSYVGGGAPWTIVRRGWSAADIYVHVGFMASANWQGHVSGVNKIFYITDGSSGGGGDPVYVDMHGVGSNDLHFAVMRQNAELGTNQILYEYDGGLGGIPNGVSPSASDAEIVRGQWHEVELVLRGNTPGSADGEIHAWLDGTKILQYTAVEFFSPGSDGTFDSIRWEPIWGGAERITPNADMYQNLDHLFLSGN